MKNKFVYSLILVTGLLFASSAGYNIYGQNQQNQSVSQNDAKYTCPVHSEVTQDQPGTCPKCGRTLVLKQDNNTGGVSKDTSKTSRDYTAPSRSTTTPSTTSPSRSTTNPSQSTTPSDTTSTKHDNMR